MSNIEMGATVDSTVDTNMAETVAPVTPSLLSRVNRTVESVMKETQDKDVHSVCRAILSVVVTYGLVGKKDAPKVNLPFFPKMKGYAPNSTENRTIAIGLLFSKIAKLENYGDTLNPAVILLAVHEAKTSRQIQQNKKADAFNDFSFDTEMIDGSLSI